MILVPHSKAQSKTSILKLLLPLILLWASFFTPYGFSQNVNEPIVPYTDTNTNTNTNGIAIGTKKLPPIAISKTIKKFREADETQNWDEILKLYSPTCKIVLIGPSKKTNFGNPQPVLELTKKELVELINGGVFTKPKPSANPYIIYESLQIVPLGNNNATSNLNDTRPQPTQLAQWIKYEVRALRKNKSFNQSGQLYLEITLNQSSGEPEITHHAWEPQKEINSKNIENLTNLDLKQKLLGLYNLKEGIKGPDSQNTNYPVRPTTKARLVKNIDSLDTLLNQIILKERIEDEKDVEVITTHRLTDLESQTYQSMTTLLTKSYKDKNRENFVASLTIIRTFLLPQTGISLQNSPEDLREKSALLIYYTAPISTLTGGIIDRWKLATEIDYGKDILENLPLTKIQQIVRELSLNTNKS